VGEVEVLKCSKLYKYFGDVHAVDGVDFAMKELEVKALIGPNGAGKTTLVNLITGYLKPDRGAVLFKGEDITKTSPIKRVKKGIIRTFQIPHIFMNLSVLDNIRASVVSRTGRSLKFLSILDRMSDITEKAMGILELVGLKSKAHEIASNLSHGDIKILDFAIALAMDPKVLILDEPTSGVSTAERDVIIKTIVEIVKEKRIPTLLIEHDMEVVFNYADKISVMSEGKILVEGEPSEVEKDPVTREVVLGGGGVR